jgi:PhzF family phenazine biosynthesis protein
MAATLDYVTLDVFTSSKFRGNPLAVVRVPRSVSLAQHQKQLIAREFNYSETTFLHEPEGGFSNGSWAVDIFTTDRELPFAGHPTIGTACYALSELAGGISKGKFAIKAGPVDLDYANGWASASIPHDIRIHAATISLSELYRIQPDLQALDERGHIRLSEVSPVVSIVNGMTFPLICLPDLETLKIVSTGAYVAEAPLDEGWGKSQGTSYFYVEMPSSESGARCLRTRMIKGTLEDPATGSAASALTSYLSIRREHLPGDVFTYHVTQGVEMGRESTINLKITMGEGGKVAKITLEGTAIKVMEGKVTIP